MRYEVNLHVHLATLSSLMAKQAGFHFLCCFYHFKKEDSNTAHHYTLRFFSHLDISVTRKMNQTTRYPPMIEQDRALASLVGSLSKLTSLDISGTHLAGQDEAETDSRCVVSEVFILSYYVGKITTSCLLFALNNQGEDNFHLSLDLYTFCCMITMHVYMHYAF